MKTALLLIGGGMRNAFASGVLTGANLHPDQFDAVFAFSSAALSAAYFLSGQRDHVERVWIEKATSPHLLAWSRVLTGHRPADVRHLIHITCRSLDIAALAQAKPKLFIATFRPRDGKTIFHGINAINARRLLCATCAIPFFTEPIILDGELHVDGGVDLTFPVHAARDAGYHRMLIIGNRPLADHNQPYRQPVPWMAFPRTPLGRAALYSHRARLKREMRFIKRPPIGTRIRCIFPRSRLPVDLFSRSPQKVGNAYLLGFLAGQRASLATRSYLA